MVISDPDNVFFFSRSRCFFVDDDGDGAVGGGL